MSTEHLGTATYSPDDNKLRFYPDARLDREDYDRIKAAGFKWAPQQELFVAPMWTPDREDLLIEWCGEVGDEDKGLIERAEERAERFGDYSDKRRADADQAHKAVESICEHIPLGQPILVGHHSERHARKDAERIESGMRRAIKMWETSQYWQSRAKGAISHAKYKERPDVRARRIKGIEADKRKQERNKDDAEQGLKFWRGEMQLVNRSTGEKFKLAIIEENRKRIHEICGGVLGNCVGNFNVIQKEGGQLWEGWDAYHVLDSDERRYKACPACTVEQCREAAEKAFAGTIAHCERWIAHYDNRLAYERAMLEGDGGTEADQTKPEKGGGCKCWASRNHHAYIQKVNKVSVTILDNWGNGGGNFTRTIPFDKLYDLVSAAAVASAKANGLLKDSPDGTGFYLLTEAPNKPKPQAQPEPGAKNFEAMRETLKAGVQVVTASNLFPTPTALAEQVADLAELTAGDKVLEPSAGTGQLIKAAIAHGIFRSDITAVEINAKLCHLLAPHAGKVLQGNFLEHNGDLGQFDKIIMNPPFDHGSDIAHIEHALTFLAPGGRLVAICANGPRQREAFEHRATSWIDLGPGAFKETGTNVNAVIIILESEAA